MRIRTIKPEFWEHPVMSRQSDAARLLAIGLLNLADDEGYFYADPRTVRNHLRQQDDDSRKTHGALTELSKIGYITITEHPTHGPIGKVVAFLAHQVINRPTASKIKALYDSGNAHGGFTDDSSPEGKGMEGNGKEVEGKGSDSPPPPKDFANEIPNNPKRIATFQQILDFAKGQPMEIADECCAAFFDKMEFEGWVTKDGNPLADWQPRFRQWVTAWIRNANQPNRP